MNGLLPDRHTSEHLAQLAHDMRTPLHSVLGFTHLLVQKCQGDEEVYQWLRNIRTASKHLLDLVNDVVDLQRLDSQAIQIADEHIDLTALLTDIVESFQPQVQTAQLEIVTHVDTTCPRYWRGDKRKLKQIVINLISNAIKFTPPKGRITIRIEWHNETLTLTVSDTGVGMDKATLDHLFEPYFHSTSRINQQGTGLGMTITQRLVMLMGGNISVSSERHVGTDFIIKLPLKTDQEHHDLVSDDQPIWHNPITILMIDDDALHHQVMEGMLRDYPIALTHAYTAKEAVQYYNNAQPDLIISDYQLPDSDGISLAKMLKQHEAHQHQENNIKIALLTAHRGSELQDAVSEGIIDALLHKPLELHDLLKLAARIASPEPIKQTEAPNITPQRYPFHDAPAHLKPLWSEFYSQLAEGLQDCQIFFEQKDYAQLASVAHRLKGQVMIFHHHHFWRLFESLEALALARNSDMIGGILTQLNQSYQEERNVYETYSSSNH